MHSASSHSWEARTRGLRETEDQMEFFQQAERLRFSSVVAVRHDDGTAVVAEVSLLTPLVVARLEPSAPNC